MKAEVRRSILDTIKHKRFVLESCTKMAIYFFELGEYEKGLEILQRASTHDNSKLSGQELEDLSKIWDDQTSMKDPNVHLSPQQQSLIALHYKNNTYYPEHWDDISKMPEMDIVEMVCDWHARSTQFGTDLLEFAKTRQENRFHFPDEMFKQILGYCKVLVS